MTKKMYSLARKMVTSIVLGCMVFAMIFGMLPSGSMTAKAAGSEYARVIDMSGLMTTSETDALIRQLDEISEKHNFDVTVITIDDIGGMDPEAAARQLYEEADYGMGDNKNGVVLMLSMGERDWALVAHGSGQDSFNEDARDHIMDEILSDLSAGNYYEAFSAYGNLSDEMLTMAEEGKPYKKPFPFGIRFIVSLIAGLIGGTGTVGKMKSSLKSVRSNERAGSYVDRNSFELTDARDRYLYSTVTKTRRVKDNDRSSGGGYSGSHGKF